MIKAIPSSKISWGNTVITPMDCVSRLIQMSLYVGTNSKIVPEEPLDAVSRSFTNQEDSNFPVN